MKNNFRLLLLNYPEFAADKDIDLALWKYCFYRQIEEYRRDLSKFAKSTIENNRQDRDSLRQVESQFQMFLGKADYFYVLLMHELEEMLQKDCDNEASLNIRKKSIYSCLVYLGDIARYKETSNDPKNWDVAESYYEKASYLCPSHGNAQNQLALIASYREEDFIAVYRYFRCLILSSNLSQRADVARAAENIGHIFRDNFNAFKALDLAAISRTSAHDPVSDKRKKLSRAHTFIILFIRLHGVFFDGVRQSKQEKEIKQLIDFASRCIPVILNEYDVLLRAAVFGEVMLFRIVAMCLFSIHFADESSSTHKNIIGTLASSFFFGIVKL